MERFVLPARRLIAAPIPKVASRTIQAMFHELGSQEGMIELECDPDELHRRYPDSFAFSFVRNPWARVHSCWKDKIADARSPGKVLILSRFSGLRPFMPFPEFVEWLSGPEGSDDCADRHWLSQVRHLSLSDGTAYCAYVGRIEAMEEGLQEVERLTGVDLPRIGPMNVKGSANDYVAAYDERTRKLVEQRYGADVERFGYRFDD